MSKGGLYIEHCFYLTLTIKSDCRGRDHMVVGSTTTYVISAYQHLRREFEY